MASTFFTMSISDSHANSFLFFRSGREMKVIDKENRYYHVSNFLLLSIQVPNLFHQLCLSSF